jgi:exopolyphosphatase / guanosine-5'-triphosphate,3'-diphosphate pyrophosphatase
MLYMLKNVRNVLFISILSLPLFCFSGENEQVVVRAAIDIGSGATKLKVAEINLKTHKIEKVLVNESFAVQYQEALEKSTTHTFDAEVMKVGLEALKKSQEIAQKHQAGKVIAVATASFRKAANVDDFIDQIYRETGIEVHVIDQQLEGILGFEATAAQCNTDPKNIIVWDIGGGSFQFSTLDEKENIVVYRGLDASIPFKNHVIESIKKEDPNFITTPNPLSRGQVKDAESYAQSISKKVDRLFKNKISNPRTKVVGIGNIFAYGIYPLVGKKAVFTQQELNKQVHGLRGKTDKDLGEGAYVNVAVTNPILVLGFMETLKIRQVDILDVNNADGALLYASFWESSPTLQIAVN